MSILLVMRFPTHPAASTDCSFAENERTDKGRESVFTDFIQRILASELIANKIPFPEAVEEMVPPKSALPSGFAEMTSMKTSFAGFRNNRDHMGVPSESSLDTTLPMGA